MKNVKYLADREICKNKTCSKVGARSGRTFLKTFFRRYRRREEKIIHLEA